MKKPKILVVGSLVMDMIVTTERIPGAGETMLGKSFRTAPGGKGANQAVQAARLGADVTMVGKTGCDAFGDEIIKTMQAAGVDTSHILRDKEVSTAVGNITLLQKDGVTQNNRILVVPGANMAITPDDVAFLKEDIAKYDMVMLQLEITMAVNEVVAKYAFDKGVPVMLNSAPFVPLSDELLSHLGYISPNEYEAAGLTGITIRTPDNTFIRENVSAAARALKAKGVKNVIITLGDSGSVIATDSLLAIHPCVPNVVAVDPTAAGDSFVGAFCTAVCAGLNDEEALVFANNAAAITVTRMGAMPSLPHLADVLSDMKKRGFNEWPLSKLEL